MKKLAEVLLLCAAIALLVGADESPDARFKRLGGKIMCTCGVCTYMLLECNHVGCPNSERMIGQLHALTGSGPGSGESLNIQPLSNDQDVLNWFRRTWGVTAIVEPGTTGFEGLAWYLPWVLPALGVVLIVVTLLAWRSRRRQMPATAARLDPRLEALRERARRETEI